MVAAVAVSPCLNKVGIALRWGLDLRRIHAGNSGRFPLILTRS